VVEEILDFGSVYNFGLEAGSKPELLAVLAITTGKMCPSSVTDSRMMNSLKPSSWRKRSGKISFLLWEKYTELELIAKYAERHDVKPQIGRTGEIG